jgi:hypothetical protein
MANKQIVTVHTAQFLKASKLFLNKQWPDALSKALGKTALQAKHGVQGHMRRVFKLHGGFIPNTVQSYPHFKGNYSKVAGDLRKRGRGTAYVRLRPASEPRRSVGFLLDHELGLYKRPHGRNKNIAIPDRDFRKKGIYTPRGATKARYKPSGLNGQGGGKLPEVDLDVGSSWKNIRGLSKGQSFVIKDDEKRFIVKKGEQKGRFEYEYKLQERAKIPNRMNFDGVVKRIARSKLQKNVAKELATVRIRMK